ncbi:MAG: PPC domain-containing protein [Pirellulales bacterium]
MSSHPVARRFARPATRVAVRVLLHRILACLGLALVASVVGATRDVRAELPMPRLDRLTPLGGVAGGQTEIEIQGADLDDVKSLVFDHPGLSATPVMGKERRYLLKIAPDVPAGTYDVWIDGRFGISNPRLFSVVRDVTDVAETEPNNSLDKAQLLVVNSVVHGTSDQNDQDLFRFSARRGQRLTLQCRAGKLDSSMDPTLSLTTAAGALIAASGDHFGRDSLIDVVIPADGDYVLAASDLSFRGGHAYQLIVSDAPQLENAFPRAITAGQTTEVLFYGRNLGPGAAASNQRVGEAVLEERRIAINPPADLLTLGEFRFLEHPTDHTTLPTAATCTLVGFQTPAGLPRELGPAVTLLATDEPTTPEAEPNDVPERAQRLTLPAVVNARFDAPRDGDWYELETTEAGNFYVDVYCERLGGRADPYVAVLDDQGNRVAELDDYGHRVNAFDGHLRDPAGSVNLAANKKYRLLVQDRYRRGGGRYQYVLRVRKGAPDFFVAAMHRQNPGPGGTTVGRGGATYLDVVIHTTDGFSGPVTIAAENPPAGLIVEPAVLHGNSGTLVIRAEESAADALFDLRLIATGQRGEQTIRRLVRPYTRVTNDPSYSSSRPMRRALIAVRDVAPFEVTVEPPQATVEAGKKVDLKLRLVRRWPDAKNAVTIQPLSFPGNFKLGNQEFKPDVAELTASLEVQAGTRPGEYTLALLAQSQVPFHKDAAMANKPNALVSLPSRSLRLTVKAPPK